MNKIIIDKENIVIKNSGSFVIEYVDINNIEIIIDKNIDVSLYIVDSRSNVKRNINYKLLDNARLVVNKFYSRKEVLEDIIINLDGVNSKIEYYFSAISIGKDKYNMVINHNNKNVSSKVINHMIALEEASIYFNIDSNVGHGNSGSIMMQETKIINLGENKSEIRPNMNILEYDVKATHGAVIGKFRDEDLFYLMSRGISYNDSLKLLIKGFLLNNFNDSKYIDSVNSCIDMYWR